MRYKCLWIITAVFFFGSLLLGCDTGGGSEGNNDGDDEVLEYQEAQWAQIAASGSTSSSLLNSIAVDTAGNVYAAGHIEGAEQHSFGNGITATGIETHRNILLVKYNPSGVAQWARTVTSASSVFKSGYSSVAVGSDGSIYAAGYISRKAIYEFGNSVTAELTDDNCSSILLVKYNTDGNAQWAKVFAATPSSYSGEFHSVTVDGNGNVYAAGCFLSAGTYSFGNGVTAACINSSNNVLLVKYNADGLAQWARTSTSGSSDCIFRSVSVDGVGNVYVGGYVVQTGSYAFGNSVSVTGVASENCILLKYSSAGVPQWIKTNNSGTASSIFYAIVTDGTGNVYAAGDIYGGVDCSFGNGVVAHGSYTYENAALVKYNTDGVAQWAKTTTTGTSSSQFYSVTMDGSGNVYAAGFIGGNGAYGFGNGVTATGASSNGNVAAVKYDSSGNAQWAKTSTQAISDAYFYSITADKVTGSVYAGGEIYGIDNYTFGNSVTATTTGSGENMILVKY